VYDVCYMDADKHVELLEHLLATEDVKGMKEADIPEEEAEISSEDFVSRSG
jgi:hypothetical protein